ncbi:MAG: hypothetical protein ACPLTR_02755 [Thermacetogeniaceae bacterium]
MALKPEQLEGLSDVLPQGYPAESAYLIQPDRRRKRSGGKRRSRFSSRAKLRMKRRWPFA